MKKLLLAASIAAASFAVNAKITNFDGFETNGTAYSGDAPDSALAAYPFADFGKQYYAVDEEERSFSANGGTVFDMFVQFTHREDGDVGSDGKLGVYANMDGHLVVAGSETKTNTTTQVENGSWHRLTIVASGEKEKENVFTVYLDGGEPIGEYTGAKGNNTVTSVGVEGSGKLDNFVARTTNPFVTPASVVAEIGSEKFETYADALSDALKFGKAVKILNGNIVVDGTAAAPYQIPDVASLKALQEAVAAGYGADKFYVQTDNIDMADAGAFAGIGEYNANPTAGKPFAGTYDGGNKKISNVTMTGRNYGGIFNQVNGGTIKNLTVENISTAATSGEFGYAIVGNAGNGATLENLTAAGSFLSSEKPGTHNMAGIVVRASAGGTGTLIKDCVNNADIYGAYTKAGGICAITQNSVTGGVVAFDGCVNNGSVYMYEDKVIDSAKHAGQDGLAGILGYVDCDTTIKDCTNAGELSSTYETAKIGQIAGYAYTKNSTSVRALTDLGGNAAPSNAKMINTISALAAVTGFQYATVANGVATTVTTLAKDGAYLLENNIAASETPVFTFTEAGTISFDAALGYTFDGTIDAVSPLAVTTSTSGTVTTYTAAIPEPAVAKIGTKEYTSLAAALAAAESGDTVTLAANIAVTEMQLVTKAVTLDLAGFAITAGERSAEAATAGDDSILCVLHGGSLTINDSSAGGTGAITGNSVFTTGVKMTKKGDTDDTKKATLVVNGGTITGYYYGIAGNGLAGRGNTEVTINGGSVYGTCANDCVAIFQPQRGTLTINGGYLEGAMGVYVKSGTATVAINGGTIKGNGNYAAYVPSTNGFNNTGDAFVVDNAGYPGGAPAPSILGGTFVSANASAIASYAKTGLERIVHFADKDKVTITTEAVASAEDVFLVKGFPGGADGKTFTIDGEVTLPTGKALTDTASAATGLTYAQAAVLGLLDETTGELKKDVTPTISIVNGKVVVSLDGTAVDAKRYTVMLNVYQKTSLTAEWPAAPTTRYELGSDDEAAGFTLSAAGAGFYKVGVTIEDIK